MKKAKLRPEVEIFRLFHPFIPSKNASRGFVGLQLTEKSHHIQNSSLFPIQVAAWTKYWVALCGAQLYYYPAKSLKATERKHVSCKDAHVHSRPPLSSEKGFRAHEDFAFWQQMTQPAVPHACLCGQVRAEHRSVRYRRTARKAISSSPEELDLRDETLALLCTRLCVVCRHMQVTCTDLRGHHSDSRGYFTVHHKHETGDCKSSNDCGKTQNT